MEQRKNHTVTRGTAVPAEQKYCPHCGSPVGQHRESKATCGRIACVVKNLDAVKAQSNTQSNEE